MAREAWSILLPLVLVALGSLVLGWTVAPAGLIYLGVGILAVAGFVCFFFRDPERQPPEAPGAIVSAGDGRVVDVQPVADDAWLEGDGTRVSVFLSLFSVHVNRIPVAGRIDRLTYSPGRFRLAFRDKASDDNEHTTILIQTESYKVVFKQIAGFVARRIVCGLREGDAVRTGQRFGMIRFGSRIDHILPSTADVCVKPGDRVRAGETVIGVIQP